jgi:hypothetical protein
MTAMSDSGYASLGPTLLARKGGAKPAMRAAAPVPGAVPDIAALAEEQLEDLGWNDMGEDADQGASGVVVPIDPASPFDSAAAAASPAHNPIVRRQQRRLEERLLADAVMTGPAEDETETCEEWEEEWDEDDSLNPAAAYAPLHADEPVFAPEPEPAPAASGVLAVRTRPQPRPAASAAPPARRAAFTLRLDPERHLKLRLAATMRGVSAQALVTDALDALLAEFEDLNTIAARLQRH